MEGFEPVFRRGGVLKIASFEGSGYLGLDPFLQKETIFPVDDNKIHPFVGMAKWICLQHFLKCFLAVSNCLALENE